MSDEQKIAQLQAKVDALENLVYKVIDFLSIDSSKKDVYAFIENKTVKRQLDLDFILMENTSIGKFDIYCQYIFFQIEALLNYYYLLRFADKQEDMKKYFSYHFNNEGKSGNGISDMSFYTKYFCFAKEFLSTDFTRKLNYGVQSIKYVRNKTIHRDPFYEKKEMEARNDYINLKKRPYRLLSEEEKARYTEGRNADFRLNKDVTSARDSLKDFIIFIKPKIQKYQNQALV